MTPGQVRKPSIDDTAWIARGAVVVGDVTIEAQTSVWYAAVLRADLERIHLGPGSNVQDGAVVHADPGFPVVVGERVSVGHGAILHGCRVGDDVLIGMHATVLNGASIGAGSLVAAGALVLEGTTIPPNSLVAGVPGKVRRALTDDEVAGIAANGTSYVELAARHAAGEFDDGVIPR
jgi:carbonic anhydrase/acetyltransferase-like protein (isoleucine patch superfamily)